MDLARYLQKTVAISVCATTIFCSSAVYNKSYAANRDVVVKNPDYVVTIFDKEKNVDTFSFEKDGKFKPKINDVDSMFNDLKRRMKHNKNLCNLSKAYRIMQPDEFGDYRWERGLNDEPYDIMEDAFLREAAATLGAIAINTDIGTWVDDLIQKIHKHTTLEVDWDKSGKYIKVPGLNNNNNNNDRTEYKKNRFLLYPNLRINSDISDCGGKLTAEFDAWDVKWILDYNLNLSAKHDLVFSMTSKKINEAIGTNASLNVQETLNGDNGNETLAYVLFSFDF